jgi:cell division protein FtsN
MNNRGNTFSLTVMVIIMALLAVFIGYLLGSWLIQLVTGEITPQQALQEQEINQEEVVEDNLNNTTIPDDSQNDAQNSEAQNNQNQTEEQPTINQENQIAGEVYVVQVGAFGSRENAERFKQELSSKGFQVTVVDDSSLYKVQLAAKSEAEAEDKKNDLDKLGYETFITH